MKILCFLLAFLSATSIYAGQDVYFTQSPTLNFARDSFYKSISNELDGHNFEIDKRYTMSRADFVKAHPPALRDHKNRKVKVPKDINLMITSIQKDLESKAKEHSLIVDCQPVKSQYVTNCGLYRYSRQKQKVDASSVRYFSIEIDRPQKWAKHIVSSFTTQTGKEKERTESKLMANFISGLDKEKITKKTKKSLLSLGAKTRNIKDNEMNGFYLDLAYGSDQTYTLFGLSSSMTLKDSGINKSTGLSVGIRTLAKEIHKINWEMSYKAYLSFNNFGNDLSDEQHVAFSISPGLNIPLNSQKDIFLHGSYSFRQNIKIENKHDSLNNTYHESNWNFGLTRVF